MIQKNARPTAHERTSKKVCSAKVFHTPGDGDKTTKGEKERREREREREREGEREREREI